MFTHFTKNTVVNPFAVERSSRSPSVSSYESESSDSTGLCIFLGLLLSVGLFAVLVMTNNWRDLLNLNEANEDEATAESETKPLS
jgi:hypothetical protein